MQNELWDDLHVLFSVDDGSLPEIYIDGLTTDQISNICAMLIKRSAGVLSNPGVWHIREGQEVPLDSVANAAALVACGEAAPFHFLVRGLRFSNRHLPDLGVHVFDGSLVIDYRMGHEWGPGQVDGLFRLLAEVRRAAPACTIRFENQDIDTSSKVQSHLTSYLLQQDQPPKEQSG